MAAWVDRVAWEASFLQLFFAQYPRPGRGTRSFRVERIGSGGVRIAPVEPAQQTLNVAKAVARSWILRIRKSGASGYGMVVTGGIGSKHAQVLAAVIDIVLRGIDIGEIRIGAPSNSNRVDAF